MFALFWHQRSEILYPERYQGHKNILPDSEDVTRLKSDWKKFNSAAAP